MTKNAHLSRRQFLRRAGAATAAAPFLLPSSIWMARGASAPNNRLTMGFIGVGKQGSFLLMDCFIPNESVQVVAVSDVDTTRRQYHKKQIEKFYSVKQDKTFKGCVDYPDFRDLIGRGDIDTLVIAVPDHWHAYPVIHACARGKDIYCEKPLSLTINEAKVMVNAVRQHNRVFQTGSMQRSMPGFWKACMLVRNGAIGTVKEVWVNVGGPSHWCDLPGEPMEPGLDWNMWLGQAPLRPYNSILSPRGVYNFFPNWRNYREYSGGGMTDWGAHHFDIAQWGLGMDESGPVEIIPPNGKSVKHLTYKYANGVIMYHGALPGYNEYGIVFIGEKGKVCVNRGRFKTEPASIGKMNLKNMPIQLYHSTNHYENFIDCVRDRRRPVCDVAIGARSVTVCHLGNLAFWNHRTLHWDPANQRFVNDPEANTWLYRHKREPWQI